MTLISTIITDAYRETNLIARGATETVEEQTEALRLLERYILSLFGNEAGENLSDKLFGRNGGIDPATYDQDFEVFVDRWYLPPGYRLKLNLEAPKTIRLDPRPEDGDMFGIVDASNNLSTNPLTIDGNGSKIEGGQTYTESTDGESRLWFYRADRANWARVTDLQLTDESPFPREFDDMLVIGLAMRLDPRNGDGLGQMSISTYNNLMKKFRARYSPSRQMPLDWALSRLDGNQKRFRRGYSLEGEFERGNFLRW